MSENDYNDLKINDVIVCETITFSKLTFGKHYIIIGLKDGWIKIKNDYDEIYMYNVINFTKLNDYINKQRKKKLIKIMK